MKSLVRPWRHLLDFRGRATRTEYGLYHVTAIVLFITLELLFAGINVGLTGGHPESANGNPVAMVVAIVGLVAILLAMPLLYVGHIAISVRRLHDHGEPGIKFLLTLIPLAGIIFWLMMIFTPGENFENEYGPDPRNPEQVGQGDLGGVFS
jgi:uncharacterized membrane protein YhaH (DUF805 family)